MHLLWVVLIGLIVGAVAKLIMPGKDPGGLIVVAGAVVAVDECLPTVNAWLGTDHAAMVSAICVVAMSSIRRRVIFSQLSEQAVGPKLLGSLS